MKEAIAIIFTLLTTIIKSGQPFEGEITYTNPF